MNLAAYCIYFFAGGNSKNSVGSGKVLLTLFLIFFKFWTSHPLFQTILATPTTKSSFFIFTRSSSPWLCLVHYLIFHTLIQSLAWCPLHPYFDNALLIICLFRLGLISFILFHTWSCLTHSYQINDSFIIFIKPRIQCPHNYLMTQFMPIEYLSMYN